MCCACSCLADPQVPVTCMWHCDGCADADAALLLCRGHLSQGRALMAPYLPRDGASSSQFSEGGALYALGLIHANHGQDIRAFLLEALRGTQMEVCTACCSPAGRKQRLPCWLPCLAAAPAWQPLQDCPNIAVWLPCSCSGSFRFCMVLNLGSGSLPFWQGCQLHTSSWMCHCSLSSQVHAQRSASAWPC